MLKNTKPAIETQTQIDHVGITYLGIPYVASNPISNEDYQSKRQAEIEWLEAHYDLNSAEGIQAIPEKSDLPHPPFADSNGFRNYTCDIDYYLRFKSTEYENVGNIDLAILCLKKSNAIRMVSRHGYRKDDYYRLVRLLAQNGFIEEATEEKAKIDNFFGDNDNDAFIDAATELVKQVVDMAKALNTDLVIMEPHRFSCPKCAQYQGRVFSLSGDSKQFPKIPDEFFVYGGIHKGCGHSFSTYIHEVDDTRLDYTLSCQTNVKPEFRKDIVAFSNRPFVDDRLPEDIAEAQKYAEKMADEREKQQQYYDHMIEIEVQRGIDKRDYKWLQDHLPNICPKSYSGYKRMKNGNTKNFQKLVARAKELGRILN